MQEDICRRQLIDPRTGLSVNATTTIIGTPTSKNFSIHDEYDSILDKFSTIFAALNYKQPVKLNVVHHIVTQGQLHFSKPHTDALKHMTIQDEFEHMVKLGV